MRLPTEQGTRTSQCIVQGECVYTHTHTGSPNLPSTELWKHLVEQKSDS